MSKIPKIKKAQSVNRSRRLRKNATDAERLLWRHLRGKNMAGVKFRRQQPLGNYIVDFISLSHRLVIELDGGHHALQKEKDALRERFIEQEGYRILRFWNNEVLQNLEGVLEVIRRAIVKDVDE